MEANIQGLAGFNPFANMEGVNNLNDPNAVRHAAFSQDYFS